MNMKREMTLKMENMKMTKLDQADKQDDHMNKTPASLSLSSLYPLV